MPAGTGTSGNYSSFILRLWVESDGGWRWGLIQHVATRKKRRFSTVSEMLDFISEYAAVGEVSIPFSLDGSDPQIEMEIVGDDDPDIERNDLEAEEPTC